MIRKGTTVKWQWGNGSAHGTVQEIYKKRVEKTLGGSQVSREGSEENPAYLIIQEDDTEVLKLQSEVERADS